MPLIARRSGRLPLAPLALATLALGHLLLLATIIALRLGAPFPLEWMEGSMLLHARRLLQGLTLYGPPSADFIPHLYPPLYPAVVALLASVLGLSFSVGRAVSALALLAALTLVYGAVRRAQGGRAVALGSAALLAASYVPCGAWFDLARVDTLYLALMLAGLYTLASRPLSPAKAALACLLLLLAFATKQLAALFLAFGACVLAYRRLWRPLGAYMAVALVLGAGGVLLATWLTRGWFWTYISVIHRNHHTDPYALLSYPAQALRIWPVALIALAAWALMRRWRRSGPGVPERYRRRPRRAEGEAYWLAAVMVALLASGLNRATQWSADNCHMTAAALIALAMGVVTARGARRLGALALLPLAVQLILLVPNPAPLVPSPKDHLAWADFSARLAELPGDVLVPHRPFMAYQAGKAAHLHQMGLYDLEATGILAPPSNLAMRLEKGRFGAVVLDAPQTARSLPGLDRGFMLAQRWTFHSNLFYPAFTTQGWDAWVYRPRPPWLAEGVILQDFESGDFGPWEARGRAFGDGPAFQPALAHQQVHNVSGQYCANSYLSGSDVPQGSLVSPPFALERPYLSFLVGGGPGEGVVLVVEGRVVRRAGGQGSEILVPVTWDVRDLVGRTATVEVRDHSSAPWGHILFDRLTAHP